MDFFDPQKQKRHAIRLAIGYALMGIALIMGTVILLHHAYGFGLDKDGRVIQNGLVFVSSRPSGASVYINGEKHESNTNTRLNLPAGQYLLELKREGYHDWKRVVTVEGGSVERFHYPFLVPVDLTTTVIKEYDSPPSFSSGSLDRRWLLVGTSTQDTFDLFDLNTKEPAPQPVTAPPDILSANTTTTGWQEVEWADNNRHVLLKRSYDRFGEPGSEYILFDREEPSQSQNLSVAFGFTPTSVELRDQAHNEYYLYDQANSQLFIASLEDPTPQPHIGGVLDYTTEKDAVVYATQEGAEEGKTLIRIQEKDAPPLTVRQVAGGTSYLLEMAEYDDKFYVAAGAASENRVFLFEDPVSDLKRDDDAVLVPVQILKVESPKHVSFSANKRFVITQNGDRFAVYDAENDRGYAYQSKAPMDKPQAHATWMDGFRLSYISGGKVVVFDFDGTNLRTLSNASPNYLPFFDRDYRFLYTLDSTNRLISTALLAPEDL